jgi:replicative DNA helicase
MKKPDESHADFPAWQEEMQRMWGLAEVIVAKQRHGSTGRVRLKFDSQVTKFSDLADDQYPADMGE